MKKTLVLATMAATLLTGAAQARKFDGPYIGLSYGYGHDNVKMRVSGTSATENHHKGGASSLHALLGWGVFSCSNYYGVELRGGRDFFSKKKAGNKLKAGWTYGLGGRVGRVFANDWLTFLRLGVDYTEYEFKYTRSGVGAKDAFRTWSLVPGAGVEYAFNEMFNVGLTYEYSIGFTTKGNKSEHYKVARSARNHTGRLSFTMVF
jgi:opacity protein-like surface antigen